LDPVCWKNWITNLFLTDLFTRILKISKMVTPLRGYTYHSFTITLINAQHQRVIGEADSREATIFKIFKIRVRKINP